jgi:hypothetical protein
MGTQAQRVEMGMLTEAQIVADYRRANPQSRVVSLFRYFRNGGAVKAMSCILCGCEGPTWCGRYTKTKAARDWEVQHRKDHGLQTLVVR